MVARPDLSELRACFKDCHAAGTVPQLWLRDDDAVTTSTALDRLAALSSQTGLPVHLAVVPDKATEALGQYVAKTEGFIPLVHGFAHRSHSPKGEKKAEFGDHRPLEDRMTEATRGLKRLQNLFGPRLFPAFVPPWNRMAPDMGDGLVSAGYRMVSTYGPRAKAEDVPGLVQVNAHVDPIDWRGTRGLVSPDLIISQLTETLRARARAETDATEPLGVLTHHLVHDMHIWDFCEWLIGTLVDFGMVPWRADEGAFQK